MVSGPRYCNIELKPGAKLAQASGESAAQVELAQDAIAVLTQLGEPTLQARQLVERVLIADSTIDIADNLVAAAYRLKELA